MSMCSIYHMTENCARPEQGPDNVVSSWFWLLGLFLQVHSLNIFCLICVVVELIFVHLQVKSVGRIYHPLLCC